jgi:maltoporin
VRALFIAWIVLLAAPVAAQWDAGVSLDAGDAGWSETEQPTTTTTTTTTTTAVVDAGVVVDRGASATETVVPEPDDGAARFVFGSYGRVVVASDLDGRTGRDADIVTRGSRIDEGTYAELELRREDDIGAMDLRIVATLAVAGPLFHFDGDFEERLAIRNLFAEVDHAILDGLSLWAGSRMVRGDDVYLLDFWPLDNLNMVGGGARYRIREIAEVGFHAGLARPSDPFQLQVDDVVAPDGFLPEEVIVLDRPRLVLAGKATWWALGRSAPLGAKLILYGESHILPSGERERTDGGTTEQLPSDSGWVFGVQAGGWMTSMHAHANLFLRYARGLGAYDPLGVPFRVGSVIETGRAEELLAALSLNWEWEMLGLQLGGYVRRFRDADPNLFERGGIAEGTIVARPHVWIGENVGIALEAGYQALETTALDERTGEPVAGSAVKLGVIPYFTPYGRGTYTRPHLRLIYAVTIRDEGAQALYPEEDPRSREGTEHFFGIGAEWWFDSSSY